MSNSFMPEAKRAICGSLVFGELFPLGFTRNVPDYQLAYLCCTARLLEPSSIKILGSLVVSPTPDGRLKRKVRHDSF
jgi:hypothetical protein